MAADNEQPPVSDADVRRLLEYEIDAWQRANPGLMEGCEPYDFDFGDREYGEWLERWLTPAEFEERERRWGVQLRWLPYPRRWIGWPYRWWQVRRRVMWPVRRWVAWRIDQIDRLARERGGPAPGPSWKIRTEWGVAQPKEPT